MLLAFCFSSVGRPEDAVLIRFPVEWLLLQGARPLSVCPAHHRGDFLWNEGVIPLTFSTPHAEKPWFNHACSRAVKDREAAHKKYQCLQTNINHELYISARNRAKSTLRLTRNSFINEKYQNLAFSNSSRDFWYLAKNISSFFTSSSFPPLLSPDGNTAVSSIPKAELFSNLF